MPRYCCWDAVPLHFDILAQTTCQHQQSFYYLGEVSRETLLVWAGNILRCTLSCFEDGREAGTYLCVGTLAGYISAERDSWNIIIVMINRIYSGLVAIGSVITGVVVFVVEVKDLKGSSLQVYLFDPITSLSLIDRYILSTSM